jgi:hypothetical protein
MRTSIWSSVISVIALVSTARSGLFGDHHDHLGIDGPARLAQRPLELIGRRLVLDHDVPVRESGQDLVDDGEQIRKRDRLGDPQVVEGPDPGKRRCPRDPARTDETRFIGRRALRSPELVVETGERAVAGQGFSRCHRAPSSSITGLRTIAAGRGERAARSRRFPKDSRGSQ